VVPVKNCLQIAELFEDFWAYFLCLINMPPTLFTEVLKNLIHMERDINKIALVNGFCVSQVFL